jgi:NADH:ubiquinone oxidoreductase subunit 3 (subunit A)
VESATAESVLFLLGLAVAATGFILFVFLANALLSPRRPTDMKGEPYECGMPPAGGPWKRVNVRYVAFALIFVVFDAETVLLYSVAAGLRGSIAGLIEVGAFALFLAFGLLYAWRKGALEWR